MFEAILYYKMNMTVIINFKLLFLIFPLNAFCSKIISPEFIFGGVNFYSLGETSLSNHSVGCTFERLGKKAIFGPFLFIMLHCEQR